MSSILEALRELEGSRSPVGQGTAAPAEAPGTLNRAAETFGIVAIGLVIGAVGFVLLVWAVGLVRARAARDEAPSAGTPQASARAERLAWLERADPPRARVEPEAAGAATRTAASVSPPPPAREADAAAAPPGRVEVTSIQYSQDPSRRSVALRLDGGGIVTLRERESVRGVEVQLIQPDSVYVRRGGDVIVLAPSP